MEEINERLAIFVTQKMDEKDRNEFYLLLHSLELSGYKEHHSDLTMMFSAEDVDADPVATALEIVRSHTAKSKATVKT